MAKRRPWVSTSVHTSLNERLPCPLPSIHDRSSPPRMAPNLAPSGNSGRRCAAERRWLRGGPVERLVGRRRLKLVPAGPGQSRFVASASGFLDLAFLPVPDDPAQPLGIRDQRRRLTMPRPTSTRGTRRADPPGPTGLSTKSSRRSITWPTISVWRRSRRWEMPTWCGRVAGRSLRPR